MSNGFKIRRHNSKIYRRNRSTSHSPLGIVGMALLVLCLFVVGWFVYPPVYDLLTGKIAEPPQESASEPAPPSVSSEPEPEPEPEPAAGPMPEVIKAVYAPSAIVQDAAKLESLLTKASNAGYNALLFDVKDADGVVRYNTENATAKKGKAVAETPFELAKLVETLANYKMEPIARLYTFKDHKTSRAVPELGVRYKGEDVLWLDNSPDKGGRSWLNPYDATAQAYLIELAEECVQGGVKMVIADGIQFPQGIGMNLATYGNTAGKSWNDTLGTFVEKLGTAVTQSGAAFATAVPVTALMNTDGLDHLGAPEAYKNMLAVNVMPALLGTGEEIPGFTSPVLNPYSTVLGSLRAAQTITQQPMIAFVQAYTDKAVPAAKNKAYTTEDISAQVDALAEAKVASYILYNPDGSYQF